MTTAAERQQVRISAALRAAEIGGIRLARNGRIGALAVLAVWQAVVSPVPQVFYFEGLIALFAVIGQAQVVVSRQSGRWHSLLYLLCLADALLLTYALTVPNPWAAPEIVPAMFFHFPQFGYFYLLPVFSLLSYSPPLVLWSGFAACLGWAAGLLRALATPGTMTVHDYAGPQPATHADAMAFISNPLYIDLPSRIEDMVILMIVSGLLALAVGRMRHLVRAQAMAERARANLVRYFSPNMVDELSALDRPFAEVRTQDVAILFVDIVGFTRLCEALAPAASIELLRAFHRRMEQAVFDHGGTLDKFLGDGVMATFGTPRPGERDAANALACARAMLAAMRDWNADRTRQGLREIRIGIGAHTGSVVLGDVGSDRHVEFAVLGDAVNVASRLETLTRELDAGIVISADLARLASAQGGPSILDGFSPASERALRGRKDPIAVHALPYSRSG